jgi:16S rRNA (guanine527-N7)-methyltransferase
VEHPDPSPYPDDPATALMQGSLLLGVPLSPHTVAKMVLYLKELLRWNAKTNLTALRTEQDIISKQFLDSLAAFKVINPAGLIRPNHAYQVIDIGSGAGFPGLVLKLHEPSLSVHLVEPATKKAAFLHHIIGLLGLSDTHVVMSRIEQWTNATQECDLLTTRAVRPEFLFDAAPRLLSKTGRILLYRARPLETSPSAFTVVHEETFTLPYANAPRTLSVLQPTRSS